MQYSIHLVTEAILSHHVCVCVRVCVRVCVSLSVCVRACVCVCSGV